MFGKKRKDPALEDDFELDDDFGITELDDIDSDYAGMDGSGEPVDSEKTRRPLDRVKGLGRDLNAQRKAIGIGMARGLASRVSRQLPGVEKATNEGIGLISDMQRLTSDVRKDLTPVLNQTKILTKQLASRADTVIPDKMYKMLMKKLDTGDSEYDRLSPEEEKQNLRDSQISSELTKVAAVQMQDLYSERKRKAVEKIMDDRLGSSRHHETAGILATIANQSVYHTKFLQSSMTAYFTKSLELKFRHLHIVQDLVELTRVSSQNTEKMLESIRHNTSLPDSQKMHLLEETTKVMRERTMGGIGHSIANFTENIRKNIYENYIAPTLDILGNSNSALEGINLMMEMEESMGGSGKMNAKKTIIGQALGGLGKFMGGKAASNALKKLPPEVLSVIQNYGTMGKPGLVFLLDQLKEGKFEFKHSDKVASVLEKILGDVDKTSGTFTNEVYADPTGAATISKRFTHTVETVIPGYLSMMTAHLAHIATGSPSERLSYDFKSQSFKTQGNLQKEFMLKAYGDSDTNKAIAAGAADSMRDAIKLKSSSKYKDASGKMTSDQSQSIKSFEADSPEITKMFLNLANAKTPEINIENIRDYVENGNDPDYSPPQYIKIATRGLKSPSTTMRVLWGMMTSTQIDGNGKPYSTIDQAVVAALRNSLVQYAVQISDTHRQAIGELIYNLGHTGDMGDMISVDESGNFKVNEDHKYDRFSNIRKKDIKSGIKFGDRDGFGVVREQVDNSAVDAVIGGAKKAGTYVKDKALIAGTKVLGEDRMAAITDRFSEWKNNITEHGVAGEVWNKLGGARNAVTGFILKNIYEWVSDPSNTYHPIRDIIFTKDGKLRKKISNEEVAKALGATDNLLYKMCKKIVDSNKSDKDSIVGWALYAMLPTALIRLGELDEEVVDALRMQNDNRISAYLADARWKKMKPDERIVFVLEQANGGQKLSEDAILESAVKIYQKAHRRGTKSAIYKQLLKAIRGKHRPEHLKKEYDTHADFDSPDTFYDKPEHMAAEGGTFVGGSPVGTVKSPTLFARGRGLAGEHGVETIVPHNKTSSAVKAFQAAKAFHEPNKFSTGGTAVNGEELTNAQLEDLIRSYDPNRKLRKRLRKKELLTILNAYTSRTGFDKLDKFFDMDVTHDTKYDRRAPFEGVDRFFHQNVSHGGSYQPNWKDKASSILAGSVTTLKRQMSTAGQVVGKIPAKVEALYNRIKNLDKNDVTGTINKVKQFIKSFQNFKDKQLIPEDDKYILIHITHVFSVTKYKNTKTRPTFKDVPADRLERAHPIIKTLVKILMAIEDSVLWVVGKAGDMIKGGAELLSDIGNSSIATSIKDGANWAAGKVKDGASYVKDKALGAIDTLKGWFFSKNTSLADIAWMQLEVQQGMLEKLHEGIFHDPNAPGAKVRKKTGDLMKRIKMGAGKLGSKAWMYGKEMYLAPLAAARAVALNRVCDVFVMPEYGTELTANDMLISEEQFNEGVYFDKEQKKKVKSVADINRPVFDSNGNPLVTVMDIKKGLCDIDGNRIRGLGVGYGRGARHVIGGTLSAIGSGIAKTGRGIGKTFKGIWKGTKAIGRGLGYTGSFLKAVVNPFQDVYLKDKIHLGPVLLGKDLRRGRYVFFDGDPIKASTDIVKAVVYADVPENGSMANQVALSIEDIRDGLVDHNNKPIRSKSRLFGSALGKVGSMATDVVSGVFGAIAGGLGGILGGAGKVIGGIAKLGWKGTKAAVLAGLKKKDPFIDVYVKNSHPRKAKMYGKDIKNNLYVYEDGTAVRSAYGIKAEVYHAVTKKVVISEEDLEAGLENVDGGSLSAFAGRSVFGKAGELGAKGLGMALSGLWKGTKTVAKGAWEGTKAGAGLAWGGLKKLGGMFGLGGDKEDKDSPSNTLLGLKKFFTKDGVTKTSLEEIIGKRLDTIIKNTTPKRRIMGDKDGDGDRDGGYKDQMAKRTKRITHQKAAKAAAKKRAAARAAAKGGGGALDALLAGGSSRGLGMLLRAGGKYILAAAAAGIGIYGNYKIYDKLFGDSELEEAFHLAKCEAYGVDPEDDDMIDELEDLEDDVLEIEDGEEKELTSDELMEWAEDFGFYTSSTLGFGGDEKAYIDRSVRYFNTWYVKRFRPVFKVFIDIIRTATQTEPGDSLRINDMDAETGAAALEAFKKTVRPLIDDPKTNKFKLSVQAFKDMEAGAVSDKKKDDKQKEKDKEKAKDAKSSELATAATAMANRMKRDDKDKKDGNDRKIFEEQWKATRNAQNQTAEGTNTAQSSASAAMMAMILQHSNKSKQYMDQTYGNKGPTSGVQNGGGYSPGYNGGYTGGGQQYGGGPGGGGPGGTVDITGGGNVYHGTGTPTAIAGEQGWKLGDSTKKYESGNLGSMAIGWDTTGGTSYGKYQIAAKPGSLADFVLFAKKKGYMKFYNRMVRVLGHPPVGPRGKGYGETGGRTGPPVTAWKQAVQAGEIGDLEYLRWKDHYESMMRKIKSKSPEAHELIMSSPALQDSIWSTVLGHFGYTPGIVAKVYRKGMAPKDFTKALYNERARRYGSSTRGVQNAAVRRMRNECKDIDALLDKEELRRKNGDTGGDPNAVDPMSLDPRKPSTDGGGVIAGGGPGGGGGGYQPPSPFGPGGGGGGRVPGGGGPGGGPGGGGGISPPKEEKKKGPGYVNGMQLGGELASHLGGAMTGNKMGMKQSSYADLNIGTSKGGTDMQTTLKRLKEMKVGCNTNYGGGGYSSLSKMNPNFLARFADAIEAYKAAGGPQLNVTSAFRTYQDQARLKRKYPNDAARPGTSRHESGIAIDVGDKNYGGVKNRKYNSGTVADLFEPFANKMGLFRPYKAANKKNEAQHFEPINRHNVTAPPRDLEEDKSGKFTNEDGNVSPVNPNDVGVGGPGVTAPSPFGPKKDDPSKDPTAEMNAPTTKGGLFDGAADKLMGGIGNLFSPDKKTPAEAPPPPPSGGGGVMGGGSPIGGGGFQAPSPFGPPSGPVYTGTDPNSRANTSANQITDTVNKTNQAMTQTATAPGADAARTTTSTVTQTGNIGPTKVTDDAQLAELKVISDILRNIHKAVSESSSSSNPMMSPSNSKGQNRRQGYSPLGQYRDAERIDTRKVSGESQVR